VPNHLNLPDPIRTPTRRAGGGGGGRPVRDSRADHARTLTQGLEAIPIRPDELDNIDPDMVFKFRAGTRLADAALESQGIEVLGEDEEWTYFVLLDDDARQRFAQILAIYAESSSATSSLSAGLLRTIDTIDEIQPYGPEDRLAPDLAIPEDDGVIEIHIRLWPALDQTEAGARVERVTRLIDTLEDCEVLATTDQPQTTAVIADMTATGLALLADLSVVERIAPPIRVPLSASEIERAEAIEPPRPRGAPIGILDDGASSVNPLMQPVFTGEASFPDSATYTWNPPSPHGIAVASLAAFYDFEEHVGTGEPLRAPHPIVMARVMEPTPGAPLATGPARGFIFEESVDTAIRWLHSQNVRVVNMSIARNVAASTRSLPDELTYVLDTLARELNMVIVLSAGNTTEFSPYYTAHHYPMYLEEPEAGIGEPGLAANALTVGGQARSDESSLPQLGGHCPSGRTFALQRAPESTPEAAVSNQTSCIGQATGPGIVTCNRLQLPTLHFSGRRCCRGRSCVRHQERY